MEYMAIPTSTQACWLSQCNWDTFYDQGYLVVEGLRGIPGVSSQKKAVLDPVADLDPIIAEYHIVLDNLADELYAL